MMPANTTKRALRTVRRPGPLEGALDLLSGRLAPSTGPKDLVTEPLPVDFLGVRDMVAARKQRERWKTSWENRTILARVLWKIRSKFHSELQPAHRACWTLHLFGELGKKTDIQIIGFYYFNLYEHR